MIHSFLPTLSTVLDLMGVVLLVGWTPEKMVQELLLVLKPRESLQLHPLLQP